VVALLPGSTHRKHSTGVNFDLHHRATLVATVACLIHMHIRLWRITNRKRMIKSNNKNYLPASHRRGRCFFHHYQKLKEDSHPFLKRKKIEHRTLVTSVVKQKQNARGANHVINAETKARNVFTETERETRNGSKASLTCPYLQIVH
jgi:hypothetical protein